MRALDAWAIERCGIPSLELMEKAGAGVADAVAPLSASGPVRIVCGKGNNGGDGLVAARKLRELGVEAKALLLFAAEELSADAQANYERLVGSGGQVERVEPDAIERALKEASVVVDALLGTGFSGVPRAPVDPAIEAINEAQAPVVAVDVPSGVDASTGEVAGACVRADATVTFHAAKVGLWIHPGKAHAGRIQIIDIGIPPEDGSRPGRTPASG